MNYDGETLYDQDAFLQQYIQKRDRGNAPNETLEQPAFDALLGEVSGLDILDLGCGDGRYGEQLLQRGAKSYHGIDASANMLALARQRLAATPARVEQYAFADFPFPTAAYDVVVSRLALHYLPDLAPVITGVRRALRPGGRLIFSVEHPAITAYDSDLRGLTGKREQWIIDNYFREGDRVSQWLDHPVLTYHRTIESYFASWQEGGFRCEGLKEATPTLRYVGDPHEVARRQRYPLFLLLAWRKTP